MSDFQSLVSNYEESYDSARNLAEELKQEATTRADVQGNELINLVGLGGLNILGKAVTRAGLSGKITQTLDDVQGKFGPIGQRAFKITRQVGSDLLGGITGHGKLKEMTEGLGLPDIGEALRPQPPGEQPEDDSWKVSVDDDILPALGKLGLNDLATKVRESKVAGSLGKDLASQVHDVLSQSDDSVAQGVASKMVDAYNEAKIRGGNVANSLIGGDLTELAEDAVARPVAKVAGQVAPVVQKTANSLSQLADATVSSFKSIPKTMGEETGFGVGGKQIRPDMDDEFTDEPATGLVSGVTQIVGLAGGNLSGKVGEGLSLGSMAAQSASEIAEGQLPAAALLAGANEALGQLGTPGVRVGQGLAAANTGRQLFDSARSIYGLASNAARGAVGTAEDAAENITAGLAPESLSGTATSLAQAASSAVNSVVGGETGTSVLSTLGELTGESAVGDEDPIGIGITAGLGLVTGIVGLGEGIADLFEHHHAPSFQLPAMPSFQSGVTG